MCRCLLLSFAWSVTLASLLRKFSSFQMFCFGSQKTSLTVGLMSLRVARSSLRPGKISVVNFTCWFPLLSSSSALVPPLISICGFIALGRMSIRLSPLPALCPCRTLSYLRKLEPSFRKDLAAPLVILLTSWPCPPTFNCTLQVLLSLSFRPSLYLAPRELTSLRIYPILSVFFFFATWPLPWDLWVFRIIPV